MNITGFLSARAAATPEAPAIVVAEGALSCAELDRAVSWTCGAFRKAGLMPGDIVGIRLGDRLRHLVTSLALARLGAGQIAFADEMQPMLRRELIGRAGVAAVVADAQPGIEEGAPRIDPPPGGLADLAGLRAGTEDAADDGELPFLLLPTSGTSSGVPNIGVLTHARARERLKHLVFGGSGLRYVSPVDLAFPGALQNAYRCLVAGGCVGLHEGRDPGGFVEFIAGKRINYVYCVPVHAAVLCRMSRVGKPLLPGVKVFQIGTAPVSQVLRNRVAKLLTRNIYIHYGTTEVGTVAIATPSDVRDVPGTVGRPVPGVEAVVVDGFGRPVPPGTAGRLRVRTPGMIDGYVGAPAETARVFREGWFLSGDLVELSPDGRLIHHGRADDLIVYNGINISPAEIENALLRHPAVAETAAFSLPSATFGDIPLAAVVTERKVSKQDLLSHCRSLIGPRAPQDLLVVAELPRNAAGKVLRRKLRQAYRDMQRR